MNQYFQLKGQQGCLIFCLGAVMVWMATSTRTTLITVAVAGVLVVVFSVRRYLTRRRASLGELSLPPEALLKSVQVNQHQEALLAAARSDHNVTEAWLEGHVSALFEKLRTASNTRQLGPLHAWVSDGLFERFETQQRLFGSALDASFLKGELEQVVLQQSATGAQYLSLTVRVTTRTSDSTTVSAQTQRWALLRRSSAAPKSNLRDGRCPSCGAELATSRKHQQCDFCEAVLNSGEHDWVLCDVSPGATTAAKSVELLDVDGLRARDETLSVEELADRAHFVFWRWVDASLSRDPGLLSRHLSEPLRSKPAEVPPFPHAAEPTLRTRVVATAVRMLRSTAGRDEASVALSWVTGQQHHAQVMRLVRPEARRGSAALGLAGNRCEACMAPMTDVVSPTCEFCGNTFAQGWCFDGMEPLAVWAAGVSNLRGTPGAVATGWRVVPRVERELALSLLVEVARADGVISPAERSMLETVAANWDLPKEVLQSALDRPVAASAAALTLPQDLATLLVDEMIELVFTDGRAEPAERKLVERFAGTMGLQAEARSRLSVRLDALLNAGLARRAGR